MDQLWAELRPPVPNVPAALPEAQWTAAARLSLAELEQLLAETFEQTLDCPELNGLRSHCDVLQSFLMGRSLDECRLWQVLWSGPRPVGCLLLTQHENSILELVYMGLIPAARGVGLGRLLVQQAKSRGVELGCSLLVLATDVGNAPAIETYTRSGFHFHRRLNVYLHDWSGEPSDSRAN